MKAVTLLVGNDPENIEMTINDVVYHPNNGLMEMPPIDFAALKEVPALHGILLYLPLRKSHVAPVFITFGEGNHKVGFAEIFPDKVYFRGRAWLTKQPKHEQVPAADCVEQLLRRDVMSRTDWQKLIPAFRLLELERVLNHLSLLQYVTQKNEVAGSYVDIWWDAIKLHFPDSTVLEIYADRIVSMHDESLAITTTIEKISGQLVAQEYVHMATQLEAGHA